MLIHPEWSAQLSCPMEGGSFFDKLVHRFVGASKEQVNKLGWDMIFNKYDDDCSGGLDQVEFAQCVRAECGLIPEKVSDTELSEFFNRIDEDGS